MREAATIVQMHDGVLCHGMTVGAASYLDRGTGLELL